MRTGRTRNRRRSATRRRSARRTRHRTRSGGNPWTTAFEGLKSAATGTFTTVKDTVTNVPGQLKARLDTAGKRARAWGTEKRANTKRAACKRMGCCPEQRQAPRAAQAVQAVAGPRPLAGAKPLAGGRSRKRKSRRRGGACKCRT